jgi:hypothetical protein
MGRGWGGGGLCVSGFEGTKGWTVWRSPSCGLMHQETLYEHPTPALLDRFVAKDRAVGARAILFTMQTCVVSWELGDPRHPPLDHRPLLGTSSSGPQSTTRISDGYIRVRRQQSAPPNSVNSPLQRVNSPIKRVNSCSSG